MEARKIRKKILFGITSLQLGGAERVLVDIVNKLSKKYDITIFSIYDKGELKADLNTEINFKSLYNCKYEELNKLKRIWIPIKILLFGKVIYRRKIKSNYDVEVAFLEGPITRLISSKNTRCKKIAWIHTDIQQVCGDGKKAKIKGFIDKKVYEKYDNLVFVSKDNMEKFQKIYPSIEQSKMRVIYNYINSELVKEKSKQSDYYSY